jgi:hypothetical protein
MVKSLKVTTALVIAALLQSCGPEPGCFCGDGTGSEIAVPNLSQGPCSEIPPPEGFDYCYEKNSSHIVDPWGMGPVVSLDVPAQFTETAVGDAITQGHWLIERPPLGT